jgi:two-component sensor histidine kinase
MSAARRPPFGLSTHVYLLSMIAAVVIPLLAFATFLLGWLATAERERLEQAAVDKARQVVLLVDSEIAALVALMQGLAASSSLASGDFRQFHAEARKIATAPERLIVLREVGPRQLVNTQVDFGTPLPLAPPISKDELARLNAGKPNISRVYRSPISNETRIAVAISVPRDDGTQYVLAITVPTTRIRDAMLPAATSEWLIAVSDEAGTMLARTRRHEDFSGTPGRKDYLENMVGDSGWFETINFDGTAVVAGYARSEVSGWLFGANISKDLLEAPLWRSVAALAAFGALALVLSAVAAYLFGKTFTGAARALAANAGRLGGEEALPPVRTPLKEFAAVGKALEAASAEIGERTHELTAVLGTVPVAVWFTYGSDDEVILNEYAANLLRVEDAREGRFGTRVATLRHVQFLRDNEPISRDEYPLPRARRGERVYEEEFVCVFRDGSRRALLTSAIELRDERGGIAGAVAAALDITDRRKMEEQRQLLVHELNHRVKNTLATVQAITSQTIRSSHSLEEARKSAEERLVSFARAHDILTKESWTGAGLGEIVAGATFPHGAERFQISGPPVWCPPSLALALSLALTELATNAVKYGALSVPAGRVHLTWDVQHRDGKARLSVRWEERGGPAVRQPEREGFGSQVVRRSMSGKEDGRVIVEYAESGVVCVLEANITPEKIGGWAPI